MTDDAILAHDHFRVYFQHKDLQTSHYVEVAVPLYTAQQLTCGLSGSEAFAKRLARKQVEGWNRIGIAPDRLMLVSVAYLRREMSDKMSQPEA